MQIYCLNPLGQKSNMGLNRLRWRRQPAVFFSGSFMGKSVSLPFPASRGHKISWLKTTFLHHKTSITDCALLVMSSL